MIDVTFVTFELSNIVVLISEFSAADYAAEALLLFYHLACNNVIVASFLAPKCLVNFFCLLFVEFLSALFLASIFKRSLYFLRVRAS